MPTLDSTIVDFVVGDNVEVRRTITNVQVGDPLVKAWLTIKSRASDADVDAVKQLVIDSTNQAQGQITDDGADGTGEVAFKLAAADTALLIGGKPYYFDIQVKTQAGSLYTPELGTITGRSQVTLATG